MAPTRRERSESISSKRKQQILDAALSVFSTKGYANSSTLEIARKAGVAQGTIFHYFPTKHDLLMATAERYLAAQSFVELIKQPPQGDTVSVMAGIIHNRLKNAFTNVDSLMIIFSEIQRDSQLREYYRERVMEPLLGMTSRCIESGVSEKKLKSLDSDLTARIVMGVWIGLVLLYKFEGESGKLHSVPLEVLSGEVARVIIEGIGENAQGRV